MVNGLYRTLEWVGLAASDLQVNQVRRVREGLAVKKLTNSWQGRTIPTAWPTSPTRNSAHTMHLAGELLSDNQADKEGTTSRPIHHI